MEEIAFSHSVNDLEKASGTSSINPDYDQKYNGNKSVLLTIDHPISLKQK